MRTRTLIEALTWHIDSLVGIRTDGPADQDLSPTDQAVLDALLPLAAQTKRALTPVVPSRAFEAQLREKLYAAAARRAEERRHAGCDSSVQRRWVLIGAAAGSILSVVGVIAAVLWRQRSLARV
jgi:hypothetical protein